MDVQTTIRSWRDPLFRATLEADASAGMIAHPSGVAEDGDADWSQRLGTLQSGYRMDDENTEITGTAGCGSLGCTKIICTDPCHSLGPNCPKQTDGCTGDPNVCTNANC